MKKYMTLSMGLLYFLSLIDFILLGMTFAAAGPAQGQGLTAGATILWYGMIFGLIAFIASIVLARFASHKIILTTNRMLALLLFIILVALITYQYKSRTSNQSISYKTQIN